MAKRTEAPTNLGEHLPPSLPPTKNQPFWLGWAALVLVLLIGGGLIAFLSLQSKPKTVPGNGSRPASSPSAPTSPSAPPSASASGGVPATTYEAFVALPSAQQVAVMQAAMNHYDAVLNQAFQTFDASVLPQIATGNELPVLQQAVQKAAQAGYPNVERDQVTILGIILSPQPYSFVSVHIRSTGTDQYLDPKTLQPIGSPSPSSGTSSFSFVIQDGVWKVSEHILDATS